MFLNGLELSSTKLNKDWQLEDRHETVFLKIFSFIFFMQIESQTHRTLIMPQFFTL